MLSVPDFFIAGAAKSGTTSLYHYLKQHPALFFPRRKEPWFFDVYGREELDDPIFRRVKPVTGIEEYRALFEPATSSQTTGEASTIYLYRFRRAIANVRRLHEAPERVRIIILLRDPVKRAFSHWLYDVREGHMELPFDEAIGACMRGEVSPYGDYVAYGLYRDQVRAWLEAFPRTRIHLFEDLVEDAEGVVRDILSFLEVNPEASIDTRLVANVSGVPRSRRLVDFLLYPRFTKGLVKGWIPEKARVRLKTGVLRRLLRRPAPEPDTVRRLREIYRDDVKELAELLDRDLSRWRT